MEKNTPKSEQQLEKALEASLSALSRLMLEHGESYEAREAYIQGRQLLRDRYEKNMVMEKMKFKVLTHEGRPVDTRTLNIGIFPPVTPILLTEDTTMESLRSSYIAFLDPAANLFPAFFENLNKCELTEVSLIFN